MAESPLVPVPEAPLRGRRKDIFALAVAVKDYLVAQGVGTFGTDLFIGQLPEDVKPLGIVIVPTGGPNLSEDPTRRPSFQIQVRSELVKTGLPKSVEINNLLDDQWNVLAGFPGRLTAVTEAGLPFKDDAGHLVYSTNYVLVTTTQD